MISRASAFLTAPRATARPTHGTPGQLPGGGLSSLPRRGFSIHGDGLPQIGRWSLSPARFAVKPGTIPTRTAQAART